jgi:hypothetical protein
MMRLAPTGIITTNKEFISRTGQINVLFDENSAKFVVAEHGKKRLIEISKEVWSLFFCQSILNRALDKSDLKKCREVLSVSAKTLYFEINGTWYERRGSILYHNVESPINKKLNDEEILKELEIMSLAPLVV